mgnify:CR=1 FL=1
MESQIQLVLFAIEQERQLEAHQEKDQILDDYRQKAIDMEEQHIHELDGLKEFFQKTVQEQTVNCHSNYMVLSFYLIGRN